MITVFTPTYNRGYTLSRLYNSLLSQTYMDFEWLIIDDGSIDNTSMLVDSFILENKIKVRYLKTGNGGKHRAINKGVALAKGSIFFIVDSDDYLPEKALEKVVHHMEKIKSNDSFAGVCGLKVYPDFKMVTQNFNYVELNTDMISIYEKFRVKGDMAEVFKTEILKLYPFPEFVGEKFISEGIVWDKIAQKYNLRYFNEPIYICDYLEDGLTKSIRKHHRNSPKGTMLFYNEMIRQKRNGLKKRLIAAVNYWRYTIKYKGERAGELAPIGWSYCCYPLGLLFYYIDIRKK